MTDGRTVRRRFLILRGSRWLPTGLMIPVFILFLVDRGLSLAEIGIVTAAQGLVVLVLEVPTGGLADAFGRRRVLLLAAIFEIATLCLLLTGQTLVWFAAAFAIQGVYRALESGPLDAWYVDAVHAVMGRTEDAKVEIERGLGRAGMVLGVAISLGAALSGVITAFARDTAVDALALPLVIALILRVVDTILVAMVMTEVRPPLGAGAIRESLRSVPDVVRDAARLVRNSATLGLVIGVELFWGFGMATFEGLFPVRLASAVGGNEAGAALMGPVVAVAWVASAVGAGAVTRFTGRWGRHTTAAWMRVLQGATVAAMGLFGGPGGLITAYLVCYMLHGAANPVHSSLIHDEAEASNRTTVASINSLAGMSMGALGGIVLGSIADNAGIPIAMFVGAVVLAAAAPLYIMAGRRVGRPQLLDR